MNIVKIMSLQEILNKDPKNWKYAEATEVLNSSSSTADQKETATKVQARIKEWLRTKDQRDGQGTTTKVFHSEKPDRPPRESVDITKIELDASEIDSIQKATKTKLAILLTKQNVIEEELKKHGLDNPPTIGMYLKLLENCE